MNQHIGSMPQPSPSRVALVTGGTDGIGRAVAVQLACGGDRVLFVGRNRQRAAEVLAALRDVRPGADHAFIAADLSSLSETTRVAERVAELTRRLDAVVMCAGVLATVPEWTPEGLERSFVLNYLSRYLLARLLLPSLIEARSGRLVLVSKAGMFRDTLDLDDLQFRRGKPGLRVSGRTQFANDLLAMELAERLRGTRVEVTCVHPGFADTSMFRNARGLWAPVRLIASAVQRLIAQHPEAAAETPVFLAQHAEATGTGGYFYGPNLQYRPIPPRVLRHERRERLWIESDRLIEPYLPGRETVPRPANPITPSPRFQ